MASGELSVCSIITLLHTKVTSLNTEVTSFHDFHPEIESPDFQIEHQINWKVDTSSRGIPGFCVPKEQ